MKVEIDEREFEEMVVVLGAALEFHRAHRKATAAIEVHKDDTTAGWLDEPHVVGAYAEVHVARLALWRSLRRWTGETVE